MFSCAKKAGIEEGDIIVQINDWKIEAMDRHETALNVFLSAGYTVSIGVLRHHLCSQEDWTPLDSLWCLNDFIMFLYNRKSFLYFLKCFLAKMDLLSNPCEAINNSMSLDKSCRIIGLLMFYLLSSVVFVCRVWCHTYCIARPSLVQCKSLQLWGLLRGALWWNSWCGDTTIHPPHPPLPPIVSTQYYYVLGENILHHLYSIRDILFHDNKLNIKYLNCEIVLL